MRVQKRLSESDESERFQSQMTWGFLVSNNDYKGSHNINFFLKLMLSK